MFQVSILQVFTEDGTPKYYTVEPVLPDYKLFKKWNNNVGFVNEKISSTTLDAFTHWTYDATGGFLTVVDLQGVDRKDKYVLTDPAINCLDPVFGRTNLGQLGMKYFFKTHLCGEVCSKMGLKPNQYYSTTTLAETSKVSSGGKISAMQKILSLKKP